MSLALLVRSFALLHTVFITNYFTVLFGEMFLLHLCRTNRLVAREKPLALNEKFGSVNLPNWRLDEASKPADLKSLRQKVRHIYRAFPDLFRFLHGVFIRLFCFNGIFSHIAFIGERERERAGKGGRAREGT